MVNLSSIYLVIHKDDGIYAREGIRNYITTFGSQDLRHHDHAAGLTKLQVKVKVQSHYYNCLIQFMRTISNAHPHFVTIMTLHPGHISTGINRYELDQTILLLDAKS